MVETLDLQDEIGTLGATNIEVPPPPPEVAPQPQKEPEKNIESNKKTTMDSTPINDVMDQMPQEMPMAPQAAPMMMPAQQPQVVQAPPPAAPSVPMKSKNPMNLTDEQMDALVAALSALVAFSGPAQERLASFVPNFELEGTRTMTGMLVSGILVAVVYFLIRRFALKQ